MGMPWEQPSRPQQPYQPAPYQPPPQNYPPQPPPQIPVVARTPTGEQVKFDMGASLQQAIREAINTAVSENKGVAAANADAAVRRLAAKKNEPRDSLIEGGDTVEEAFQSGAVTTMTFVGSAWISAWP